MTLLRLGSPTEYRPQTGFVVLFTRVAETTRVAGATPSSVSVSRPFDVIQHEAATYARVSCLTVQRPRPFSGPRRVAPPCAYLPYFMQEHPWVWKSSECFPLRPPRCAHRPALPSVLFVLTSTSACELQLRGFEQLVSPYPYLAWFRRQPDRYSRDLFPSRSSPTSLGVLLPDASSHGLSHASF